MHRILIASALLPAIAACASPSMTADLKDACVFSGPAAAPRPERPTAALMDFGGHLVPYEVIASATRLPPREPPADPCSAHVG